MMSASVAPASNRWLPNSQSAAESRHRIVLNARDAGIRLQTASSGATDLRLVQLTLTSLDARIALTSAATAAGLTAPKFSGSSVQELYQAENGLLQAQKIIPLFQLPVVYALSPAVKDWRQDRDGTVHLENAWLGNKP